jgi:hypothetical protein
METQALTAELPQTVFMVWVKYPPPVDRLAPLTIPLPPVGFGMPVFGDRKIAEEFCGSPNVDVPHIIKEAALEQFVRLGENPPAVAKEHDVDNEYLFMIDPLPMHEWDGADGMGDLLPMDGVAEALRRAGVVG